MKQLNQRGFTLVEVVVSVGILSILLTMFGGMLYQGNHAFSRAAQLEDAVNQVTTVLEGGSDAEVITTSTEMTMMINFDQGIQLTVPGTMVEATDQEANTSLYKYQPTNH